MFTQVWFWCFVASGFIAGMCPFGGISGTLNLIARIVFMVLVFFKAEEWWYGLILIAINFLVPLLTPRVDPHAMTGGGRLISVVGNIVALALTVVSYVSLL